MITLVVADNHPVVRAGLRTLLSAAPDIQIVGEAENGNDIQPLVAQLQPKILLLGLKIPGASPIQILKWMRTNFPKTSTLVLTADNLDAYFAIMLDAGAVGVFSYEVPAEKLTQAIRYAVFGEVLFDKQLWDRAQTWRKVAGDKWNRLSKRQKQTLKMFAQGTSKAEVANRLEISLRTVEFHVTAIMKKLKVKSLLDAVCWLDNNFPDDWGTITG